MINPDRQIVLDTETTGMNQIGAHYEGHCIIEIGAVEMINRKYTGNNFHIYIKPDRLVDPDAIKVHGITDEMLADKPDFKTIAQDFIEYIRGAELLIHNAPFDVGFMDYEFRKLGLDIKTTDICLVTDTLQMARQMYPGKRNSLDALCDRLGIDKSARVYHGAFVDCELLAKVYLAMTQGQYTLAIEESTICAQRDSEINHLILLPEESSKLIVRKANAAELKAHEEYLDAMPTHPIYRNAC